MNKRKMVTLGILAAALVCGLALAGCKQEAEVNPFIATWISGNITLVFGNETQWVQADRGYDPAKATGGTYTRNGNVATMTNSDGTINTATVNGNQLTLTGYGISDPLLFTKQ
jgi:hypothetical protein